MPSSSLTLRERQKRRTRTTIARVTVELVAQHGFGAVRVEDICEAAEVSRSTFFRYFDSKESSYVVGFGEGRLEAVLDALERRPDAEDGFTAIREAISELAEHWHERPDRVLLDAEIRTSTPAVAARANSELLTWEISIAAAIEERVGSSPTRRINARLIAALAMTAVRIALDHWLAEGGTRSPAQYYRQSFAAVAEFIGQ
jgi:AcrR family transcriptional regulator